MSKPADLDTLYHNYCNQLLGSHPSMAKLAISALSSPRPCSQDIRFYKALFSATPLLHVNLFHRFAIKTCNAILTLLHSLYPNLNPAARRYNDQCLSGFDTIIVSHFISADHLTTSLDFYFQDIINVLAASGRKPLVVSFNHTSLNPRHIECYSLSQCLGRYILKKKLPLRLEVSITYTVFVELISIIRQSFYIKTVPAILSLIHI